MPVWLYFLWICCLFLTEVSRNYAVFGCVRNTRECRDGIVKLPPLDIEMLKYTLDYAHRLSSDERDAGLQWACGMMDNKDVMERPFEVLVVKEMEFDNETCVGVLMNQVFVLLPAHCTGHADNLSVTVRSSSFQSSFQDADSLEEVYAVSQVLLHPNYTPPTDTELPTYDIAMLRLQKRTFLRQNVLPTCLAVESMGDIGTAGISCFFNIYTDNSSEPETVPAFMETTIACHYDIAKVSEKVFDDGQFACVRHPNDSHVCANHYRGPLHCLHGTIYYVVGLISFVHPNCCLRNPDLYTNVAELTDWIFKQMEELV